MTMPDVGFPLVLTLVIGMMTLALFLAFVRLALGPSLPDRVISLDNISMQAVGLIAVYAIAESDPVFLDGAIVLALISFLGTVALARYVEKGSAK